VLSEGLAPVLTQCHACRHPLVEVINRRLTSEGWAQGKVSDWLKELGPDQYISRNSLGKHYREHLMEDHERARKAAADAMEAQKKTRKGPKTSDLAVLVRDTVLDHVESGILIPTIAEGLRGQEIIDRRAEKGADRDLMLQVAQLLGGAVPAGALMGPIIEGQYVQIDPEAAEDEAEFLLLEAGPIA
jgi:hypothetical protein